MKAAIYSRKSRFSEHGESIRNQIQMCTDYLRTNLNIGENDIEVFEDEGYSGKNTDRPEFQKLLARLKNGEFKILACYRLDRISRNVGDFSRILDMLQAHNIDFVSINERFDTTTPIGRAMIHISSVFAQLERETIAERVKDNYYRLAKTGRWLGGTAPLGYKSKLIRKIDIDGSKRSLYSLETINSEADEVRLIFNKYIETQSLYQTEKFLTKESIHTRKGAKYSKTTLRAVLRNPVYAIADSNLYEYLKTTDCLIADAPESFDGTFGTIAYNKTVTSADGKRRRTEINDWIVAIGKHTGIISSKDWIKVQTILSLNKEKAPRTDTSHYSLFANSIICADCGSRMRILGNRRKRDGSPNFYYKCDLKDKSEGTLCNSPNIQGVDFDRIVLDCVKHALADNDSLKSIVENIKNNHRANIENIDLKIKHYRNELDKYNFMLDNLVNQLAFVSDAHSSEHIRNKMSEISEKSNILENDIKNLLLSKSAENIADDNLDVLLETYNNFNATFDNAGIDVKRRMLKTIIKSLIWDNGTIKIEFYAAPALSVNFSNYTFQCNNGCKSTSA